MARKRIEQWLEGFIVAHDICPFARKPYTLGQVHIELVESPDEEDLTQAFLKALEQVVVTPRKELETTLLVITQQLTDFDDFWSYYEWAQELLEEGQVDGLIQLVGFHPDFRFAEQEDDAFENFVNRAPFPIIQLLREESVSEAVAQHPDITGIPERNSAYLRRFTRAALEKIVYVHNEGDSTI